MLTIATGDITRVRWGVGVILLCITGYIIICNWGIVIAWHLTRKPQASWLPLLGGIFGMLGLLIIPDVRFSFWWWLPPLVDWGTIPGIAYTLWWIVINGPKAGNEQDKHKGRIGGVNHKEPPTAE